jgi:hypothetical protein
LDRFFFKLQVPFPSRQELAEILKRTTSDREVKLEPVLDASAIRELQQLVRAVPVGDHVTDFAVRCVLSTHPDTTFATSDVKRFVRTGVSPVAGGPKFQTIVAFDIDRARAEQFQRKCLEKFGQIDFRIESDINNVLKRCSLISFATTAAQPYVADLAACPEDTTILHVSLRDLSPEVILKSDNVADDIDHVCRANTSLHLAEQLAGHREFIRCNLADVLSGVEPVRKNGKPVVFSPFGLGVLDLAVSKHAYDFALERGLGTSIGQFLPASWIEQN